MYNSGNHDAYVAYNKIFGGGMPVYEHSVQSYEGDHTKSNALTHEEIDVLTNNKENDFKFSTSVGLAALCTHVDKNGRDVLIPDRNNADSEGYAICPICKLRVSLNMKNNEEIQKLVTELVEQMEITKCIGGFDRGIVEQLSGLIALLNKYPNLHTKACDAFNTKNKINIRGSI